MCCLVLIVCLILFVCLLGLPVVDFVFVVACAIWFVLSCARTCGGFDYCLFVILVGIGCLMLFLVVCCLFVYYCVVCLVVFMLVFIVDLSELYDWFACVLLI